MTHTISLDYLVCGCHEEWTVELAPPPDDTVHRIPHACVPEHCQSCEARGGRCADREAAQVYKPVQFAEVTPVRKIVKCKQPAA